MNIKQFIENNFLQITLLLGIIIILLFLVMFLSVNKSMTDILTASGTIAMAIATVVLSIITYNAYNRLVNIEKGQFEPHLSINLKLNKDSEWIAVIKNNGPGIAKKIVLFYKWGTRKTSKEKANNWGIKKIPGGEPFRIENKKEEFDENSSKKGGEWTLGPNEEICVHPEQPDNLPKPFIIYSIALKADCVDQFGNHDERYGDSKVFRIPSITVLDYKDINW